MSQMFPRDVVFYDASGTRLGSSQPLVAGATYYTELGGRDSPWTSIQWKWDSSIIISSFTYYSSNLPNAQGGEATGFWGGLRPWDTVAGGWNAEPAITTAAVAGGTAGNALVHIGGDCAMRLMCKIVVGATGGNFRGIPFSKRQGEV